MKIYIVTDMVADDYKCERSLHAPAVFRTLDEARSHARGEMKREYAPNNGYDNVEIEESQYGNTVEFHGWFDGGEFRYRIDEVEA